MFRRFSINFALFSMVLDGTASAASLWMAAYLRWVFKDLAFLQALPTPPSLPGELWVLFPLVWVVILLALSVYDGRRNFRALDEFTRLVLGAGLAMVIMAGMLFLSYRELSRALFITFIVQGVVYQMGWRAIVRLLIWRGLVDPRQKHKVLIAGAGEVGTMVRDQIRKQAGPGVHLLGFVDDDPNLKANHPGLIGSLDDIRRLVADLSVDDVVIAFPRSAHRRLNCLVAELHDLPVKVWIIPDYFSLALHRATVEDFAGIPMLDLRAPALTEYQRMVKRAFDLVVTVLCLIPSGVLFGIIAIAIKLDSPGPVLFSQKRVGENGRLFEMLKFRTMVENAEQLRHLVETTDANGRPVQAKCLADPRITRVGRFLRRTSLDEIPQFLNVLRGEMSLIGPRPEMPHFVEKYELWQRKRFAIPQGMTGWWQVNGRSDKPMYQHTEEDLYYVQHYSLWLDLQILIRTFWVVLRGKGAY